MVRREDGAINEQIACQQTDGAAITRNPGVVCLWTTRSYRIWKSRGGASGYLITIGDPERVNSNPSTLSGDYLFDVIEPGWSDTERQLRAIRRFLLECGWPDGQVSCLSFRDRVGSNVDHADEIADAVVFLASDLARAITGQCLDVNAGEFHH